MKIVIGMLSLIEKRSLFIAVYGFRFFFLRGTIFSHPRLLLSCCSVLHLLRAGVCAGIGGVLLASFICFLFFRWKIRKVRSKSSDLLFRSPSLESSFKKDPEGGSVQRGTQFFRYEELHEATNGFISSNELGDGGFGTVYKGATRSSASSSSSISSSSSSPPPVLLLLLAL